MKRGLLLSVAVAGIALTLLAACAGAKTSTPTPRPTAAPTAAPTVTPTLAIARTPATGPTATPTPSPSAQATLPLVVPFLTDGVVVESGVLAVVGTTRQDAAIAVNGTPVEVAADGSFRYDVLLDDATNLVEVVATDQSDSVASVSAVVFYIPPEVGLPFDLFYPVDGLEVDMPGVAVVGATAQDAMVAVNGEPVEVTADGMFATRIELGDGVNLIEVVATDITGETRSATVAVFYYAQ
jgi:hypothetical protein